nr:CAP domain-containing protein [Sphingobium nicotianae]
MLTACGGDSGASGTPTTIPTPTPSPTATPSPTPTPTPAPTPTPTPTPAPTTWSGLAAALYDVQPDVATCKTGTLKTSVRTEFLTRLNALRALHNLPAVTYSSADDQQVDDSSLMMAANKTLSHTPPTSWLCYTSLGATGAGSSNLIGAWSTGNGLGWSTEDSFLALWLTENGSIDIGHRRWVLDPFLGKISYGRVTQQFIGGGQADTASMKVFGFAATPATPTGLPAFVAYPYGNYPTRYFGTGDYLSFSVVANTGSRGANGSVSFASATVSVANGSTNLTVTDVAKDNNGYGLPNNIQWRVANLQPNVSYTVTISGVTGAPQTSYSYTFKIVP